MPITTLIPEWALRAELPAKPDFFDKELAKVATMDGKPVFRVVNGQTETKWQAGKHRIKYPLRSDDHPAVIPVVKHLFRRKYKDQDKYEVSGNPRTLEALPDDKFVPVEQIEESKEVSARVVGRACWIIEVLLPPNELNFNAWTQHRYGFVEANGVERQVDLLGEFPKDGMYMFCFPVVDDEGNAVSPGQRHIDECKYRWKAVTEQEPETLNQAIKDSDYRMKLADEKQLQQMNDNFYQDMGIAARTRLNGGVIGKPILKEKTL